MTDRRTRNVLVLLGVGVSGLVIAGIALIVGTVATVQADRYDPDVVKCGDEVMSPLDTCFEEGDSRSESQFRSYSEVRSDQRDGYETDRVLGPVGLWTAGVCGVLGLGALVVGLRGLRRLDGASDGARRQAERDEAIRRAIEP